MCGIAGLVDFQSGQTSDQTLRDMIRQLHHRGPDDRGFFQDGPAGLAHARLSIIDLGGGGQPIHNEDKSVWVIFNGEIFNYIELRQDLLRRGHQFYTESDTEVIVHLYEEKGEELFSELNGQFAIAIWDSVKQRLVLGRDRVGIRPLFFHKTKGKLSFASEVKALLVDRQIPRQLDLQSLSDIFTCWAPLGDASAFQDIKQLLPGHYAIFDERGFRTTAYWCLGFDGGEDQFGSIEDYAEALDELMKDAIRLQLRADVPVGAYLSGGLDSTYISGLVKHNFNNRLRTYSVGFQEKQFDETLYQQQAAHALGTDHKTIQCTNRDIGEIFPKIIWHAETPLTRTAPGPLYMLSRLVREDGFKVVLTGEGADELFAGYNLFKEDKVRRFWARNPDSAMRPALLSRLYPYIFNENNEKSKTFTMDFFKQLLESVDSPAYSHLLRWKNTGFIRTFFNAEVAATTSSLPQFVDRFCQTLPAGYMGWDSLSRAQYTENVIFLSNYLLSSQGDRMAMGNSIEGRYPFLDHRIIEFATRIPARYRLRGLQEKAVLKVAARNVVPQALLERKKQPYRAPISQAFLGPSRPEYVDYLLSESSLRETRYFDPKKVALLIKKCGAQTGHLASERENMALVAILSTQLLHHQFLAA